MQFKIMSNIRYHLSNLRDLIAIQSVNQMSGFVSNCFSKRLAALSLLSIALITNALSQNNIFVYEVKTTLAKEEQKAFNLKNLEAILIKNKTNEPLDVLFTLFGDGGTELWNITPKIVTVQKDSILTVKINRDSLNKYFNSNKTLFLDEGVSGDKLIAHQSVITPINNTFSGSLYPFQDALLIADLLQKKTNKRENEARINTILSKYCGANKLDTNELHAAYASNSFIVRNIYPYYFSLEKAKAQSFNITKDEEATRARETSPVEILGGTLGGLNATIVADAFAKIIIKRFKQDLNEIFFQKMKEEMEKNVELRTLLPRTYDGLTLMDRDIFQFNQFIEGLRQKMEEDLVNVLANTNDLLETNKYRLIFKENPSLRAFLTTVTQFSDGLIRQQHPSVVIENLHFSDAYDETDEGKNLKAYLQTLQLFSKGLQSNSNEKGWEQGLDNLNQLFKNNAKACQIWLGLLHQMAADGNNTPFTFENGTTLRQTINKLYDERNHYYNMETYVKGFIRRVNQINMSLQNVEKTKNDDGKMYWDKLVALYDNTVSLVKFAPTITQVIDSQTVMPLNWHKGLYIAETVPHIYAEMQSRNYNAAVQHISSLLKASDFRPLYIENYKGPINAARFYERNTLNSVVNTYTDLKGKYIKNAKGELMLIKKLYLDSTLKTPVSTEEIDKFVKYASFTASLVLAKTSDEMANLLETTLVPPGSTRMKEFGLLLGINSYLGLQYVGKAQNGTPITSITAPIGFNFSVGIPRKPKYLMSKSERFWSFVAPHNVQAIFTLIDVGAIVGLRFNNNQDSLPKISLSNIFSPGVIVQFGRLFNLPLNIGVGYQSQPRLYGIKDNALSLQDNTFRFNLNLSWDIPLWNLRFWEYERRN